MLPRAARWYLYALWATALAAIALALTWSSLAPPGLLVVLVAFGTYVLADYFEVDFAINGRDRVAMTVVDAPTLFLVPLAGPYGVLVIACGSLVVDALRRRDWYRGLFNAAERSIVFLVMVTAYQAIATAEAPPFSGLRGLLAFAVLAGIYYTLNTLLVSTIVALASGRPLPAIYIDSYRQVSWVHFITLPFGAILAYIWVTNPWLILVAGIPLLMAHRSFKAVAAWQEESRRSQELARQATELVEELRAKQAELVRSSQLAALGTFAASIAHEFNNLLTAILGFAQLGLSTSDIREKDDALEVALRACTRGQSITSGLLTFARRRDPNREPCRIDDLVSETVTLLQPEFTKVNVQIEQQLQPLPSVSCDSGQIAQVLVNLLTNARDAMREQGGGQIVVSAQAINCQLELAIRDTGAGIPEELLPQIFQPFVTTKGAIGGRKTSGTGLGLSICHTIIENHGGTISVQSVVGEGTTMTVRLPLGADDATPPVTNPPHGLDGRSDAEAPHENPVAAPR